MFFQVVKLQWIALSPQVNPSAFVFIYIYSSYLMDIIYIYIYIYRVIGYRSYFLHMPINTCLWC